MTQFQLPTTSTVEHPEGWGYGARLDELLVRLAVGPGREAITETARNQAQRVQTEANAEDFVPEFGQVFSRSQFDGGEGLDFAHRPNPGPNDRARFWDSMGMGVFTDVPGELSSVELLEEMETIASTGTDGLPFMVHHPDGYLLRISGENVLKVATPSATPSVTTEDPFPSYEDAVLHLVQVGDETFANASGASAKLSKRNSAGTWTELTGALDITSRLWYVKGRLMGAINNSLYVINQTDGTDLLAGALHVLPSGETWRWVVDAGPIILAAGGGELYLFQEQSGSLVLVNQTSISETDEPMTLGYAAGTLLIGTREAVVGGGYRGRLYRAYVGSADASFALVDLQLLRTWEPPSTSNSAEPRSFIATRDSIYFGVWEAANEVNIWRYYLPTGGLSRDRMVADTTGGLVCGLAVVDDLMFASCGGNLLVRDSGLLVDEGYIITPLADHFTAATKSWLGVTTHVDNLVAGGAVEVFYTTKPEAITDPADTSWRRVQLVSGPQGSGVEIPLDSAQSRWLALMVKITPDATKTSSPKLRSVASRAFTDSEDVVLTLPVNISDRIERPGRRPLTVPGWGNRMYTELLAREGSPVVAERYNPPVVVRGTVEAVQMPERHQPRRGSAADYALVLIRGKVVTSGSVLSSEGSMGVGALGIGTLGV